MGVRGDVRAERDHADVGRRRSPQQNLAEVEKAHTVQTLERCGWNHSRAAEALGIARTTLWRKLKDYDLDRGDAKDR